MMEWREFLMDLYRRGVEAVTPERCMPGSLPDPPVGRTVVVGAGKAAASMARVVEEKWGSRVSGLVVTRYGHAVPCERIEVVEAGHPIPDEVGMRAAERVMGLVSGLGPDDMVLCLFSGGGSSLLALPAAGISLPEKRAVTQFLLESGASIGEINSVRKHLSRIKGGRLALACSPARVVNLIISDVPGDDPSSVASGPSIADPTTLAQAVEVLDRYGLDRSSPAYRYLISDAEETPKPGDSRLSGVETCICARAQDCLEAAAWAAGDAGLPAHILGDAVEGEARDVARVHAALALQVKRSGRPYRPPCVLLSGGETTVTVVGQGRGGRNTEYLLSLALALQGERDVCALACDTDGIDGTEDAAGAILSPDILSRALERNVDPWAALEDNDSYGLFSATGDLVVTGPTRTNVNDFRAILVAS